MQIKDDKDAYGHLKWMRNRTYKNSGLYGYTAHILRDGFLEENFVNVYTQMLDIYVNTKMEQSEPSALKEIIDYFEPRFLAEMFNDSNEVIRMNELYKLYDMKAHRWKYETSCYDANTGILTVTKHTPEEIRKYQSMTQAEYNRPYTTEELKELLSK